MNELEQKLLSNVSALNAVLLKRTKYFATLSLDSAITQIMDVAAADRSGETHTNAEDIKLYMQYATGDNQKFDYEYRQCIEVIEEEEREYDEDDVPF